MSPKSLINCDIEFDHYLNQNLVTPILIQSVRPYYVPLSIQPHYTLDM